MKVAKQLDTLIRFYCPGCKTTHHIQHGADSGPNWGWNGSLERPTFTPSVLVTGTEFTPQGQADFDAWHAAGCPPRNGVKFDSRPAVCHSFVTDGRIQFLGDCTHALAGQTVDLPPITGKP